jgi:amino acid permease
LEFWILLIIIGVAALFFVIYKVIKRSLPVNAELEEKLHTKSDDKQTEEKKSEKGEKEKAESEKGAKR